MSTNFGVWLHEISVFGVLLHSYIFHVIDVCGNEPYARHMQATGANISQNYSYIIKGRYF